MKLCKHDNYTTIDWIREPRYHDDCILISKDKVDFAQEHLLIKFTQCNKYPDWFYMSKKKVRKHRTQTNGKGEVYVVPMREREIFEPIKFCNHMNMELL